MGIKKTRAIAEKNAGGFALFNGNRYFIIRPKFEEYLMMLAERGEGVDDDESEPEDKKSAKSKGSN